MSQTTNQTLSLILFVRCFQKRWDLTCPSEKLEYRLIYISGKKTPSSIPGAQLPNQGKAVLFQPVHLPTIKLVGHPRANPTLW